MEERCVDDLDVNILVNKVVKRRARWKMSGYEIVCV